jgi:recombinational DNA repair ATPase RecF
MSIEVVQIRGVRGVRDNLELCLGGSSLLVLGDNGTGKSSIEVALRWALTGEGEPSLDPSFSTPESFRRHVGTAPDYPLVQIKFKDESSVTVRPGEVTTKGNGARIRDACRAAPPFLRRTELLDVLSKRPVERFQYFESFLGLGAVDRTIKGLADAKAAIDQRVKNIGTTLHTEIASLNALRPTGEDQLKNLTAFESWALHRGKALGLTSGYSDWQALSASVKNAVALITSGGLEERRAELRKLLLDLEDARVHWENFPSRTLEQITQTLDVAEGKSGEADLLQLIDHAIIHLQGEPGDRCPVCSQSIVHAEVLADLKKRAKNLDEVRLLRKELVELLGMWERTLNAFRQLLPKLTPLLVRDGQEPIELLKEAPASFIDLVIQEAPDQSQLQRQVLDFSSSAIRDVATKAIDNLHGRTKETLSALPSGALAPDLQMLAALVERIDAKGAQIRLLELEQAAQQEELQVLQVLHESFRKARQDTAKATLVSIQSLVAQYYAAIHPPDNADEATGAPSIEVQRHGKGTAFVRGEFSGHEVDDPRVVYSDGHLDTVGICIFLALRRNRSPQPYDPQVLVLDDIVLSIDLGHARRLITLLRGEFGDHQLVMLTHNGLFAHWCKGLLPGLKRVHITGWTLEKGPVVGDHNSAIMKVRHAMAQGDAKDIALHLMELMDEWLAEARFVYSLPVEARYGEQYTLTDIWNPFVKRVKGLGKKLESDLGGAVDRLADLVDLPRIRNLKAAHENEIAKEFPRATMVSIAKDSLALIDALYCEECVSFVIPTPTANSPEIAQCPAPHIQYVRPQKPLRIEES